MWELSSILLHVLMLGLIFKIYFNSTIIKGLQPQETHRSLGLEPPADRLVVFVADGLRAESFFKNYCESLPSIQKILNHEGLAGIARTCAATQSRTGHIAIFAGFNEDPGVALTSFHKSSEVYDTIFNRSEATWGWGAREVIKIFSNILPSDEDVTFDTYNANEDIVALYEYDNWAAEQVQQFLSSAENVNIAKSKKPAVFLIHLGDLDVAGHKMRPNSETYLKILNNTQKKIGQMYESFERKFPDKRTTYLLTSGHGMSDSGTHGANSELEIEVPFVLWGAGVNRHGYNPCKTYKNNSNGLELPVHDLEQTQLAPLMSALIGLPPPMNNMAELPLGYMNVSAEYEALSMYLNAKQMLAQFEREQESYPRGLLTKMLRRPRRLDKKAIEKYYTQFARQLQTKCTPKAVQSSRNMTRLAMQNLDYFKNYYRVPLCIACLITYMGWFYYLLAKQRPQCDAPALDWISMPIIVLIAFEVVLGIFLYLEKVSRWTSFFLLIPLVVWVIAWRTAGLTNCCAIKWPVLQVIWIFGCAVFFVATTYRKELVALGFVIIVCVNNWRAISNPTIKVCLWMFIVALLTGFALVQPLMNCHSKILLYLSMMLTLLRPLLLNEVHEWRVWLSNGGVLASGAYCVYCLEIQEPICCFLRAVIWSYVVYAMVSIPYSNTRMPLSRVQLIMFNLSTIYTLLSLSYESIFMQLVCSEYLLGLQIHFESKNIDDSDSENDGENAQELEEPQQVQADNPIKSLTTELYIESSYRYALLILIYTYFTNTGVNNLPNIGSLDPNITHLFASDPSPLLVGCLTMLKFFIPHFIIVSTMYACCVRARKNSTGIYIALVLICDAIALYFFVFVQKNGSWIGMRSSLSNLLLVHGLPIMFVVFSWVPKQFLSAIPLTMLPTLVWKNEMRSAQPDQTQA